MKRLLLSLTLATSMMASLSSFAGGETSGGGDAVYVEDQLVLRDFLESSSFKTILHNEEFLHSIPDFKELILDISKVHPELALEVVRDLMRVTLYQSSVPLPLLPASTTAFSGPKADVQLAIRSGREIILHPGIESIKDASYVMVHEALHSLLLENKGPMHHHRVRAIVKYLKEKRGSYDKDTLQILLDKNKFDTKFRTKYSELEFFKLKDLDLKCYAIRKDESIQKYFNLDCKQADIENFLRTNFFSIEPGEKNYSFRFLLISFQASRTLPSYRHISKLELPATRFYQKKEISDQKYQCNESNRNMEYISDALKEATIYLTLTNEYLKGMASTDFTASEKLVIEEYLDGKARRTNIERANDSFRVFVEEANNLISIGEDNARRCAAKFPNEL